MWAKGHDTLGKFRPNAANMAIVEEQTNAAELDSPDPIWYKYMTQKWNNQINQNPTLNSKMWGKANY